jgi:NAD(P) transhydrogenase subunit beta
MSSQAWINLAYLTASMLFIVAFKQMSGPRTAVRGNLLGATGMAIAILAACFEQPVTTSIAEYGIWPLFMLIAFAAIGGGIGDRDATNGCSPQWIRWSCLNARCSC